MGAWSAGEQSAKKQPIKKQPVERGPTGKESVQRRPGEKQSDAKHFGEKSLTVKQIQVLCVMIGFLLSIALKIAAGKEAALKDGFSRAGHGEGAVLYEVLVEGIHKGNPGQKETVEIPVGERQYTDDEAETIYEQALPELVDQILGENPSLEQVRSDLTLTGRLMPYGFQIHWESDSPEILDSFGGVHNEKLPETGREVYLKAALTDGVHDREYDLRVAVFPPLLTEEERELAAFSQWVKEQDKNQETEEKFRLPEAYEGRTLKYRVKEETDYRVFPVLGILAAVLLPFKEKSDKQQAVKKREQQLLLDYSEVVSKLMVFIGAGMTIRLAWERIVRGYEQGVKKKERRERLVYEEMRYTADRMASGISEGKAYEEFGRRCGLQPYVKLAALLEQNRKTGSKNLKSVLELEMASAFEQRKNLAKRLGEEAGTKLLLPLFLMLGIVMVMIVVPAFLSFY